MKAKKTMAKLTSSDRKALPTSTFAEPKQRKYPIPDISHARNALARVSGNGSSLEKEMVRAMLSESLQAVISQTLCKNVTNDGRVAAHEIMLGSNSIRNLIREGKVAQMYSAIQMGNGVGMQTLDQNLMNLVKSNRISRDEARSKAKTPESFNG
jgi:twitching motility protein PilT